MERRYERNLPALTEAECAVLRTKRVLVVGCGGLGGHIIDQLCRIGIGSIRLADGDVFDETNLNRQLLSRVSALGRPKTQVAREYIAQVNPAVQVEAVPEFMTKNNVYDLVGGCDAVIDALDNIPSRRILSEACEKAGVPYVYGAIQGWLAQAALSLPGDKLVDILFPQDVHIRDKSVLSFTPALCASLQTALCVKYLTGREVAHGTVFCFDLLNMEFETIPLI